MATSPVVSTTADVAAALIELRDVSRVQANRREIRSSCLIRANSGGKCDCRGQNGPKSGLVATSSLRSWPHRGLTAAEYRSGVK